MKIKKIECQQNLVFQIKKIANSITDKRELEGNFNCNRMWTGNYMYRMWHEEETKKKMLTN